MCKSDQRYVSDCPKQICQGCDERGHYITKCGKIENAGMAVGMPGRMSTDDDSTVCSEADFEAYTTLEITTGECLVSIMEEGIYGKWGAICGFLTQGLLVTSSMIVDHSRIMLSAVGCYVVREVTLS